MSKRLIKYLSVGLGILLVMGLMGSFALAAKKELTPYEFSVLSPEKQKEYRNVVVKIPHDFYGFWKYPIVPDKGVWESQLEAIAHSGNLFMASGLLRKTLFELEHPRVKVIIDTASYPDMMAALAGGTAPACYGAWGLPSSIEQGVFADITDLVKKWDRANEIPMSLWQTAWKDGRCYARPAWGYWNAGIVECRKDWFKEAGIFNKIGEPLPEDNWTYSDLREIAKKLTDPKKKRWGFGYSPTYGYGEYYKDIGRNMAYGRHYFVPDKTGKYTWRFNTDPVIAETLKWIGEMMFKDKSLLTSPGQRGWNPTDEFKASRIGMYIFTIMHNLECGGRPTFSATIPRKFYAGPAFYPQGPYGIRRGIPKIDLYAFNPTLSKEQKEAVFEWMNWNLYGKGRWYQFKIALDESILTGRDFHPEWGWSTPLFKPKWEIPGIPKESDLYTPDQLRKRDLCWKIPEEPLPSTYGLEAKWSKDYDDALSAMYSKAITDPNCDYQAVVNETAEVINKTCWNYKIKDDKKKFKEYYTALGEFYKEHYPEFYEKEWPNLLEKYYKVW